MSLGVQKIDELLPGPVYALLSGLNSATVAVIALAAVQLSEKANQTVDNYWIRANPNLGTTGFANGINSAILRYSGADEVEPTTTQTDATAALTETALVPLENPGAVSILFNIHYS